MGRDAVRVAEAAHARLRPPVQPAGALARPVEHAGDGLVGHQPRAGPDQVHRLGLDGPACLAPSVLPNLEAGVVASSPVQQELDSVTLHPRHDLAQHDADDALARSGGRRRMVPGRLQIRAHPQQSPALLGAQDRRLPPAQLFQLRLQRAYGREGCLPTPLEFAGHEAVVGIDRVVSPTCPGRLIARLLECQLDLAPLLAGPLLAFGDRVHRRLDSERLQQAHDLRAHRRVDPQRAERDAGRGAGVVADRVAVVAADVALGAVVADEQPAPAMAAAHEPGEQRLAPAHRAARHHPLAVGVVGDQPLVPLVLRPRQVALVVVDEQDRPLRPVLAVASQHALAAVLDRGPAAGPAEGVSAGVHRVGEQVVHRRVDRELPERPPLPCCLWSM